MKKIIKDYKINLIMIFIAILVLVLGAYLFGSIYLIYASIFLFSLAHVINKNYIKKKKYSFSDKYKIITNSILLVLEIVFLALAINSYSWSSLGYAILFLLIIVIILLNNLLNILFRLYYRIRYKQTFNFKKNLRVDVYYLLLLFSSIAIFYFS